MSDYDAAKCDMQRIEAIEYLFAILDGPDRDGAIDNARTWLGKEFGESYFAASRAFRAVQKVSVDEFPAELET